MSDLLFLSDTSTGRRDRQECLSSYLLYGAERSLFMWTIETRRFFGEVVTGCGVGASAAAAAISAVVADPALPAQLVVVAQVVEDRVFLPDFPEALFADAPAVDVEIPAGLDVSGARDENEPSARETPARDRKEGGRRKRGQEPFVRSTLRAYRQKAPVPFFSPGACCTRKPTDWRMSF